MSSEPERLLLRPKSYKTIAFSRSRFVLHAGELVVQDIGHAASADTEAQ
jgi:hypothetical protein